VWGWGWSPGLVVAGSLRYAWYDSYTILVIPPFEQSLWGEIAFKRWQWLLDLLWHIRAIVQRSCVLHRLCVPFAVDTKQRQRNCIHITIKTKKRKPGELQRHCCCRIHNFQGGQVDNFWRTTRTQVHITIKTKNGNQENFNITAATWFKIFKVDKWTISEEQVGLKVMKSTFFLGVP